MGSVQILNLNYKDIGSPYFILFPTTLAPAIEPLGFEDIEGYIVHGHYVNIEYHDEVDEKTLICRGFAKTA